MKQQKMCWKNETLPQKLYIRYKNAKRKLEIASQMSKDSQNLVKRTPMIRERKLVPRPRKKTPSKKQYKKSWTIYLVKMYVQKKNLKMPNLKLQNQSKN